MKNFQLIFFGENFSLSKQSKAHPRQMQLGMRSFQTLQVQASPSSCDMIFNNTDLQINNCNYLKLFVLCSGLLKRGQSHT